MNKLSCVLVVIASLLGSIDTYAQIGPSVSLKDTCSYFGEALPENVATFSSTSEAREIIDRIVDRSGLIGNFEIRVAGVPNAAAITEGSQRYILYNQNFIREISTVAESEWAATSILAHEVGHHLNGHTLDRQGSRPTIELEADYFSGYILQKLGANIQDAQAAMNRAGDPYGSSTHPPKHDRLAAIASGWAKACDQDPTCDNAALPPMTNERSSNRRGGPDSCMYVGDGRCDEPGLCEEGTDTTDCRVAQRLPEHDPLLFPPMPTPLPRPPAAQYCVTQAGTCAMVVQLPVGSICACYTPYGAISGVARVMQRRVNPRNPFFE